MAHLPSLIQDLGVILITAAATTLLFKRFKQPVVLGYLIAGFLVGPHVHFFPNIVDLKSVHVWAEIGVIFLLFGLGLEFSFKKLAKVGKSAAIAALFEIVTMTGAGYLVGQAFGWGRMDSLFLGAMLSMSSTTIIIRAFQELGLKAKGFVALVFGVLIVEDLAAILIMVLLTIVASPQTAGASIVFSIARLGFFLVLWFVVGIYFLPPLLKRVKGLLSDETILVLSLGLCLMMVIFATHAGFSPALGAFMMGSILAETQESKRIEHLITPVRDLFGAVFFVSVGMMVDPAVLRNHFGVIVVIIAVTIIGKLLGSGLGALLSGRNLKQSMQAGLSLAQIGEFSFLIATLGITLNATSEFLYPIVIAVSAVTTFTTPYMIKCSEPVVDWLERHLPQKMRERLTRYELGMANASAGNGLSLLLREYGPKVILNSVVVIAISLIISRAALPKISETRGDTLWLRMLACVIALGCCVPFLRAIVIGASPRGTERPEELEQLRRMHFGALSIRVIVAFILLSAVIAQFTNVQTVTGMMLVAIGVIAILFSRYSEPLYQSIEKRFLENLNEKERAELANNKPILAPWDATLAEFVVSPHSKLVARRLEESALKETTGATIAMIDRAGEKILAPGRTAILLPYDRISLIGNDEQLALARSKIEVEVPPSSAANEDEFGLGTLVLRGDSPFVGQTIRECGLREEVNGLIVGIERQGKRMLNPDSSVILQDQDNLWIVGDLEKLSRLKSA